MTATFKQILRRTPLFVLVKAIRSHDIIRQWKRQGRPLPPPPVFKQSVIRMYGRQFHLQNLIETGTYLGEMVAAQQGHFVRIVSIELDAELFRNAKAQFAHADHITILQGDSSQVLPAVVKEIDAPCLFWLDAHYSGGITARGIVDTPIVQELEIIFSRNNAGDVILIDDVHCFNGNDDYPNLADLKNFIAAAKPGGTLEVEDNIIRFHQTPPGRKPR